MRQYADMAIFSALSPGGHHQMWVVQYLKSMTPAGGCAPDIPIYSGRVAYMVGVLQQGPGPVPVCVRTIPTAIKKQTAGTAWGNAVPAVNAYWT